MPKKKKKDKLEKFRKFVEETISDLLVTIHCTQYRVNYCILPKDKSMSGDLGTEYEKEVLAEISADPAYLKAHINIYPSLVELFKDGDKREVRRILAHEISHLQTSPLGTMAQDRYTTHKDIREEIERLTEFVGRLVYDKTFKK